MHTKKFTVSQFVIHFVFILFSLICILPLLLVLSISLTNEQSITLEGYHLIPQVFSTKGYQYVLSGASSVLRAYGVTVFVTVVGTFLHLLITSMLAYALSRPEVTWRNKISFYVYCPLLFNGGLIPTYITMTQTLKLKNSIWVLIVVMLASSMNVMIMKNFFRSIPNSLIESARIDGSGEIRTFFTIVVPISTPSFATIGLFVAVAYWNDWYTCSLYIDDRNLYSLQYLLQTLMNSVAFLVNNAGNNPSLQEMARNLPSESARMATCILSIGPIILLYPLIQKYFKKGLTIGAVKG